MSEKFTLQCGWCDRAAPSSGRLRCGDCNGPLKVNVALPRLLGGKAGAEGLRDRGLPGLWSWFDLLPISDRGAVVSLGEGRTPLLPSAHLGRTLGVETLLFKDETRNPTGSFKDRMLAVGVTRAVAEQLAFDLPDWMIVPVGGGGNIGSLWRGFLDLRALGLVERLPRMLGVQAEGCAPFVDAVRLGLSAPEALERRWPVIETLAGAIADDVVFDAHVALPAVRDSGGTAVAVSDADTLAMQAALAASEGLFVEPASATSLAAIPALLADGRIERHHRVLVLLTGTGLKDPASARRLVRPVVRIPLNRRALAAAAAST